MKRIALISFHTCPLSGEEGKETGGMNIYVLETAKNLSKMGFLVDVFTRDQDETKDKIVVVNPNFRVIHLDAGPKTNIPKKKLLCFIDEFVESFKKFSKEENITYDLLDCHYFLSGKIGLKIQKELKKTLPLIMTFHTLALMKNLVAKTPEEQESVERIEIEKEIVKHASIIISPSETDKEYLKYLYGCKEEKIFVISPGVNVKLFKPMPKIEAKQKIGADLNKKIILFVGRIEPLKGIDTLIYAIKILLEKKEHKDIMLWIVGGDISQRKELWSEELQKLEALRKLLGIGCSVKFIGRKLPEELPFYYNAAEVAVVASQYESFGMTALEAMACNTPVITTDVTGVSNILDEEHEALIGSAGNPLYLASQIEYLLENITKTNAISQNLYQKVQDLNWPNVTERIIAVYKKFI